MPPILRCGAVILALLSSACVTKLFDKEYVPPRGAPLSVLKFLPMERGSYTVEFRREDKWLYLHGEVREQRKLGGSGAFASDFQALRSEVVAGQPTTLALVQQPGTPGAASPCRVQLLICGAADTQYEVVMETGEGRCSGYFQQQSISDGGVLRHQRLSEAEAADCSRGEQP